MSAHTEQIRAAMVAQGMSLRELARRMGVTPACVSYLLRGERRLMPDMAVRLARALPVDARGLLIAQVDDDLRHDGQVCHGTGDASGPQRKTAP